MKAIGLLWSLSYRIQYWRKFSCQLQQSVLVAKIDLNFRVGLPFLSYTKWKCRNSVLAKKSQRKLVFIVGFHFWRLLRWTNSISLCKKFKNTTPTSKTCIEELFRDGFRFLIVKRSKAMNYNQWESFIEAAPLGEW